VPWFPGDLLNDRGGVLEDPGDQLDVVAGLEQRGLGRAQRGERDREVALAVMSREVVPLLGGESG